MGVDVSAPEAPEWASWPVEAKRRLLVRLRRELWLSRARGEQLPPSGDWRVWYIRGGRGSGKTRSGAETLADWISQYALSSEPGDWGIVAPTFGDARDVCVEGPSGLLQALGGEVKQGGLVANWNRTHGELFLPNGSRVFCDGADDGALRVQGKNLRGAWCDEVGLWKRWDMAWNESVAFAVRLEPGRIIATGTPKAGHGLVKSLLADSSVAVTHMRLKDNLANLHPSAVAALVAKYGGTRRGRQELDGELLEDVEGALWSTEGLDEHRRPRWTDEKERQAHLADMQRIVVGVDPNITTSEASNSAGVIVAGINGQDLHGEVLADETVQGGPRAWAQAAVAAYHAYRADRIVAESNQGGEMVRLTLETVDRSVPIRLVTASRGKRVRAEPVAALYEQGRVHHVGVFPELEEQMTTWTPDAESPDRMDALVWALTDLMLGDAGGGQTSYMPKGGGDDDRYRDRDTGRDVRPPGF